MNARAHVVAPVLSQVHDLTRWRIERALRQRLRYRYVQPQVQPADTGWLITSPCCSRNIDPSGGPIPIACLLPVDDGWALYAHHHEQACWVLHNRADRLQPLLDQICADPERRFWP